MDICSQAGCIVKAFLLAAGHGTRLRPLTDRCPKCLLPIRGTPMLDIWIEKCRGLGIREVLVNVHSHAEQVRQFVSRRKTGVRVEVVEEPTLLGSAGTLRANAAWVAGEELFWVFYADVLTNSDLRTMMATHLHKRMLATLGLYRVPDPSRCGIVKVGHDDIIEAFVEKPRVPESDLAFAGLMIGTPALFPLIPERLPSDIGFHLLPLLAGKMAAHHITDYLVDIGTLETYQHAQRTWPGTSFRETSDELQLR